MPTKYRVTVEVEVQTLDEANAVAAAMQEAAGKLNAEFIDDQIDEA